MHSRFRISAGFSLIELLVVIAIIAILASMLLPAMGRAKFAGMNSVCKSNLRQIGVSTQIYVSDTGVYPPFSTQISPTDPNAKNYDEFLPLPRVWIAESLPFFALNGVWRCPMDREKHRVRAQGLEQLSRLSYPYNGWGVRANLNSSLGLGGHENPKVSMFHYVNVPTRETAVQAPTEMIAFGDRVVPSAAANLRAVALIAFPIALQPSPYVSGEAEVRAEDQALFRKHRGKFNRVFCDGHIESENLSRKLVVTDEYLRRWNNDHEPHRSEWR